MSHQEANKKITINELLSNEEYHVRVDAHAFFYDWFCSDSSLKNRALELIKKLRFLVEEGLINGDTNYVWFKNNCPMSGNTYDDLRISDIESDDFLGGFCFSSGHASAKGEASFWLLNLPASDLKGEEADSRYYQREYISWREMKKTLKKDDEVRALIKKNYNVTA